MMNPIFARSSTFLLALLLLSACSHETPVVRSAREEQAIDFNQRAQRAFMRGEYQTAAGLYENALRLDAAIENVDGIAVNLLNLAKVNQALGKPELAQQYLDRLLHEKALYFPRRILRQPQCNWACCVYRQEMSRQRKPGRTRQVNIAYRTANCLG